MGVLQDACLRGKSIVYKSKAWKNMADNTTKHFPLYTVQGENVKQRKSIPIAVQPTQQYVQFKGHSVVFVL